MCHALAQVGAVWRAAAPVTMRCSASQILHWGLATRHIAWELQQRVYAICYTLHGFLVTTAIQVVPQVMLHKSNNFFYCAVTLGGCSWIIHTIIYTLWFQNRSIICQSDVWIKPTGQVWATCTLRPLSAAQPICCQRKRRTDFWQYGSIAI